MPPRDDIDRLMDVMHAAFDPAFGEAWTRRQIEDALLIGNCHYLLINPQGSPAEPGEETAGFSLTRYGYEEEELLLFAVQPKYRRLGLGRIMLQTVFDRARERGAGRIILEMRKGNPAQYLYAACGFQPVGERRDYYRTPDGHRIDAITFAHDLAKLG
ncbi:GNAT family N-acetyltransferase [Novosphingobium album (ex Liu et al. 2023)]|uniref:GNAT family N-acetyltransferase n=1 Tax=Novosphingobium album (ex Liu et al. 2023) TaxID=3031130 RepID=A0ABT5WRB7_9SPHN|nr:GNAT family N-acetyltransferase [Novosphingobium album (ex Liu et al. 2023)]MDE8652596.1 GNAT family N-acetyltransferase [Novosphingobium album (ex Liu et al. 2023)]